MVSLERHVTQLVDAKCAAMIQNLQSQINELKRENSKLRKSKPQENGVVHEFGAVSVTNGDNAIHFEDFKNENGFDDEISDCPDLEIIDENIEDIENDFKEIEELDEEELDDSQDYENGADHTCKVCLRTLSSRHSLVRHINTVHTTKRPYKCNLCASAFKSIDVLRNHQKIHVTRQSMAPRVKLKKSKKKLLALLAPDDGKCFKCSICKEGFPSRGAISKHSKQFHFDSKPFQCDECGIGFTRRGTLRIHQEKQHSGILSSTLP